MAAAEEPQTKALKTAASATASGAASGRPVVHLLDYGAGNVRSVRNAISALGYAIHDVESEADIEGASVLVFPGVGSFGSAVEVLESRGWVEPLRAYCRAGRPFFGVCLGMQLLFESSEETPGAAGLGVIPGSVTHFRTAAAGAVTDEYLTVPHIGWNGVSFAGDKAGSYVLDGVDGSDKVYFVHSFRVLPTAANADWTLTTTTYGGSEYVSSVQKGDVVAAQFHPEKSGATGLRVLGNFLRKHLGPGAASLPTESSISGKASASGSQSTLLAKRVIAALDVRSNDAGDLVVTKGDQYDVREAAAADGGGDKGAVRNLGKPVTLAQRYYDEGADEIVFLNITSFRQGVLDDAPMLKVLEKASENIFVPLTVGGGIRDYTDSDGRTWSALEVAARYFRAGADKVSIGSDAVYAAEKFRESGHKTGDTSIEQIFHVYGRQAVVVSIDPQRVYVDKPEDVATAGYTVVKAPVPDADGKQYCWYQATVKGGREARDIDAVQLARACEELGAGELMINCINADGQGNGFELGLIRSVMDAVAIPVIASSGAGAPEHFTTAFNETPVQAALAAGMFHRKEVTIAEVKGHMASAGVPVRG